MSATHVSRRDLTIHASLAAFFNLQDGKKSAAQLYADVMEYIFTSHHVVWAEADVKSVLRAAKQRGGAIEHEMAVDEARKLRYAEAQAYIAANSQTRTSKRQAIAVKQRVIDEYNAIISHTHLPPSMAQLALHQSLHNMTEKGRRLRAENEIEERRVQAAIRERNRAEAKAKSEKKAKEAEESGQKKREEAAAKAAKEANNTRKINTERARALMEHNRDRYKRKREERELKAAFMESGLKAMAKYLAESAAPEEKAEDVGDNSEENKENVENHMPQ